MTHVYHESFLKFWGNFFKTKKLFSLKKILLVPSTTSTTSSYATGRRNCASPVWKARWHFLISCFMCPVIHGLSVGWNLIVFTGKKWSNAVFRSLVKDDANSSDDGLSPNPLNHSFLVDHKPKAIQTRLRKPTQSPLCTRIIIILKNVFWDPHDYIMVWCSKWSRNIRCFVKRYSLRLNLV